MEKMKSNLLVTPAPHLYHRDSVNKIMWIVFLSLVPAWAWGVYYFGLPALYVSLAAIFSCLLTEIAFNLLRRGPITLGDGSAAVTGILLAFTLPPYIPLYIPIAGGIFAIGVVKQLFGGLGYNVMNPALAGRVFVMFSWIGPMTAASSFLPRISESFFLQNFKPAAPLDALSSATPLGLMKTMLTGKTVDLPSESELFFGLTGGSMGEISALLILLGALWLFKRKYITWHVPLPFLGAVAFFAFFYALGKGLVLYPQYSLFKNALIYTYLHLFSGGLILGAFYMCTDMITTPLARWGQAVMGAGVGLLTVLIRVFGGYPEGVMFAILLMELVVPLIDRISKPKIYGWGK